MDGEDITVEDTLLLVRNAVSDALEQEEHDYFKMLLQRVQTSIESSEILLEQEQYLDVPVLVRVIFEHVSRVYLSKEYGDDLFQKHNPSAFQFMGVGPGPNQLFKDLGDDFRMIYESLCSFSHPDPMGLMLNSQTKANDFSLKMVIHNALLSIISIMGSAYPDLEIDYEEMLEGVKHHMNVINQNIQYTLGDAEWIEQMMALKDHPLGNAPFRREEMNQQVFEMVNMFNEHGNEEAKAFLNNKVQELIQQLEDDSSS